MFWCSSGNDVTKLLDVGRGNSLPDVVDKYQQFCGALSTTTSHTTALLLSKLNKDVDGCLSATLCVAILHVICRSCTLQQQVHDVVDNFIHSLWTLLHRPGFCVYAYT